MSPTPNHVPVPATSGPCRLTLGTWTGRDGEARSGLNLAVWEVQPMGQIGRRKPKVRDEQGAVPLDDPLTF